MTNTHKPITMKSICSIVFGIGLSLAGATTNSHAEILFSDNFSGATPNPPTFAKGNSKWVVDKGVFTVDGSGADGNYKPTVGELNFGVTAGTRIHVDLTSATLNSLQFKLRNSNETKGNSLFTIRFEQTADPVGVYDLKMALNPNYFKKSGIALFTNGEWRQNGVEGVAIQENGADDLNLEFDPVLGVTLTVNGHTLLQAPNTLRLQRINRVSLINETGRVSWLVDNVLIEGTTD